MVWQQIVYQILNPSSKIIAIFLLYIHILRNQAILVFSVAVERCYRKPNFAHSSVSKRARNNLRMPNEKMQNEDVVVGSVKKVKTYVDSFPALHFLGVLYELNKLIKLILISDIHNVALKMLKYFRFLAHFTPS